MHHAEGYTGADEGIGTLTAPEEGEHHRPLPRTTALGVAAVGALLLSSCVGIEQENGGSAGTNGETTENGETEETEEEPVSLEEFCADAPEPDATDEDRILDGGALFSGEDPEEVPMPYLDQLDADEEYAEPTEDAPAENVPEPEIPALICDDDQDGASAALSYWFEAYWYGDLTGDASRLQELHGEDCQACDDSVEEIERMSEDAEWLVGDPMTAELHLWDISEEDEDARVGLIETDIPAYSLYDESGEVEEVDDAEGSIGVEFTYDEDAGHWKMTEQYDATIGEFGGPDPNAEEPEMPSAAEEDSPEGALATHEYWMEAFDYVWATGDAGPIQEVEHPDGEDWSVFYEDFVSVYEEGGWIEFDGQLELGNAEVYYEDLYDADLDEEAAFVSGLVTEPEATVHQPDGGQSDVDNVVDEPVVYLYQYNDDAGHWQLYDLAFDTLDDIQEDLGEPDLTG